LPIPNSDRRRMTMVWHQARLEVLWGAQAASLHGSAACRDASSDARPAGNKFRHPRLPASCRQLQAGSLRSPEERLPATNRSHVSGRVSAWKFRVIRRAPLLKVM
jgi:hypothetical protein